MSAELSCCTYCDSIPCECDSYDVHPRFSRGMVDPEREQGFKTARWTQRLLAKGPVRVDPVSKAFWEYDSGVWRESRDVVAVRLPISVGDTFRSGDIGHVESYMHARLLRDGLVIRPDQPDTRYISLPSGLYDIEAGEVVDHNPDVVTTYQLQVDPELDALTLEYDQFLESVLHQGDWDRVHAILSYLVQPGNPLQKAVMLTGHGGNGKGVLLRLIESIIGRQHAAGVSLKDLAGQFAASELYGKAINIVGDIDGDHITHTGKFKQITGGDTVRMDVKHKTAFRAEVWAVPVFSANAIPTSADTSHGYLRRWEVIEFPNTFDPTDDPGLEDRLQAELPAITGSLLQYATAHGPHIPESAPGQRAHGTFAKRSDPVRLWLDETELSGFVERKAAYFDYEAWIQDGNGKTALTKTKFYARVAAVMGDPRTVKGSRGWHFGG